MAKNLQIKGLSENVEVAAIAVEVKILILLQSQNYSKRGPDKI